jgi:hypothetical protein
MAHPDTLQASELDLPAQAACQRTIQRGAEGCTQGGNVGVQDEPERGGAYEH